MSKYSVASSIVDRVVEEAKRELLRSIDEAEKEAMAILDKAEEEAMAEAEKLRRSASRRAEALKKGIVGDASLKARSLRLNFIEEAIEEAVEKALDELSTGSLRKDYEKALPRLIAEGIELVGGEELVVLCNDGDLELVRSIASKMKGKRISVEGGLDCKGGVVVRSKDGAVIYINTLEDRVERARPVIRKRILELLGGGRAG